MTPLALAHRELGFHAMHLPHVKAIVSAEKVEVVVAHEVTGLRWRQACGDSLAGIPLVVTAVRSLLDGAVA